MKPIASGIRWAKVRTLRAAHFFTDAVHAGMSSTARVTGFGAVFLDGAVKWFGNTYNPFIYF